MVYENKVHRFEGLAGREGDPYVVSWPTNVNPAARLYWPNGSYRKGTCCATPDHDNGWCVTYALNRKAGK